MHPFGLATLLQFLWEHGVYSLSITVLGLLLSVVFLCRLDRSSQDAPATLPHLSLSHVMPSLKRRHDFFAWGFKVTNQRLFQFTLLRTKVVVVSGEQGRKDFFSANGLDVKGGFRFFSGELPVLYGLTTDRQRLVSRMYKSLLDVQRHERMAELIPEILNDGQRLLQLWGKAGSVDPFEKISELIFQATVRCLTCTEIADDPKVVARYRQLFNQAERLSPAVVLFPWFPSPSMLMRTWATKGMYDIIAKAMKVRKQSGIPQNDALQMLLDSGEEHFTIVGFMMGFVLAGARATGSAASWLVTYLGCHPNWRNEARAEVKKLIASHSPEAVSEFSPSSTTTSLSSIPLSAWENETPVLDMIVREAVRLSQAFVSFRRNAGPEMYIDGKVIPTGALVAYPAADVHLDPDLYPDPWKFNPARPQPKGNLTYLSWGVGRTTCIGMRLARLNTKLIVALLLMDFDFDTVDVGGEIVDPVSAPKPNWNDPIGVRPVEGQFFVRYTRQDDPKSRVAGCQESSAL